MSIEMTGLADIVRQHANGLIAEGIRPRARARVAAGELITWAREHHMPPARWTLSADLANALKAADDD